ncbi:bile acid:sodium symporter family protein [Vibrio fluvialis]|jgi:BASS family bile acid:Na+ symporter|uniref:bile acid:sodium symporter family protein n=1 Tax=Vibrio fluvialis TaxID=676 RepID=UPI0006E330FE|nr:bile acid:sodium symporter family protein [Vibrio fluvialis]EKO3450267.1 bile acid:sodium symporter family protein [Vibrio fluvialis]EKO3459353.1 bile acid:sodium symporter family protein [Vibrio fluvialis]EKO3553028.1 bile acid:sodium symporter family protein [Vibrio fluvialis]EKO3958134.1 bile acid:sodium symporter family protein [Vibrio fluvialis]EMA2479893.1 bile acid:sodium symporter family protein [Vibrio fluvialis]
MLRTITQLFPLWAVLFSLCAYFFPSVFVDLKSQIVPLLTIIMLAMGLTLKPKDFLNAVTNKKAIGIGLILQFSVMPLAALLVSLLLGFDPMLTIGMVLVGSVAGGTSSNVMCYLAKGDVALSITMTSISTLLGVVLTPLLVKLLAGQSVDVPAMSMLMSLVKIVLVPVSIGLLCNVLLHSVTEKLEPVLPLISMVAIVMIIAIVVALNASQLATIGPIVALAVILHNSIGLASGYWICRALGFNESICRTVAFEVGLQNSGLATALAMKFFTPASAVAGTIFSIWHNLSGSLLAGYWAKRPLKGGAAIKAEVTQ